MSYSENISLDLHYYDGKLLYLKEILKDLLDEASSKTKNEKLVAFEKLQTIISQSLYYTSQSHMWFSKIVEDFLETGRVEGGPNHDSSNNFHADDLLYLCYEMVKKDINMSDILAMQLHDISTGSCQPGRTTRLLQAYVMGSGLQY